ncbi:MAG: flagellar basal body P-ring formation protein FlgA [Planctomycetota bacterium]|nr:MAG: flagellar basal body P-ring formation protein FlgA [Planctomycetota bacterium]
MAGRNRAISELLTTMLVAAAFLYFFFICVGAEAGVIRLSDSTEASDASISLGDIAEITGFDNETKELVAGTALGDAPDKGETRTVTRREIELRLQHRGVDLKDVEITGALKVEVSCSSDRESLDVSPIRRAVQRFLAGYLSGRTRVEILCVDTSVLKSRTGTVFPEPGSAITISAENSEIISGDAVFVYVSARDAKDKVVSVTLEVSITKLVTVVRINRNLPGGFRITEAVCSEKEVPVQSVSGKALALKDVIGKRTARRLAGGDMLTARDVVLPPVIMKGKKVRVTVKHGSMVLTTTAVAQEDGAVGDTILVQNPTSRRTYTATVEGPGRVRKE